MASAAARVTLHARCDREVERVTVRTTRDTRTLIPSRRARVVYALYDGDFSSGQIELAARMNGGRTNFA